MKIFVYTPHGLGIINENFRKLLRFLKVLYKDL